MASIPIPKHDHERWKQLFATSLKRMNGEATAAFQRPILQSKDRVSTPRADIAEAANCLAALWDISRPKRQGRRCGTKTRESAEMASFVTD